MTTTTELPKQTLGVVDNKVKVTEVKHAKETVKVNSTNTNKQRETKTMSENPTNTADNYLIDSQPVDNSNNRFQNLPETEVLPETETDQNDDATNSDKNRMMTTSILAVVGFCAVGLIAVSGYRVVKKRSSKGMKSSYFYSSTNNSSYTYPSSLMESGNKRSSLVNSLINEDVDQNKINSYINVPYSNNKMLQNDTNFEKIGDLGPKMEVTIDSKSNLNNKNEEKREVRKSVISVKRSSISSVTTVSRNSIIRHSFLNPDLNIVRTSKRTQQLYEATNDHPAIIETFPSLERPFVPAVPIPLEESDINSLHPHSIYQTYQDDMEYENYYAYTIEDKEYIIDPSTNRVLEIHDLNTDEYMLVEEDLYLDFSGSDDSDTNSEQQETDRKSVV